MDDQGSQRTRVHMIDIGHEIADIEIWGNTVRLRTLTVRAHCSGRTALFEQYCDLGGLYVPVPKAMSNLAWTDGTLVRTHATGQ